MSGAQKVSGFKPLISGGVVRDGINPFLRAGDHDLDHLSFDLLKLPAKTSIPARTERNEALVVVLEGVVTATAGAARKGRSKKGSTEGRFVWDSIGRRLKPNEGPPYAFYVPPGTAFALWGEREALVAVMSAESPGGDEINLITPESGETPPEDEWRLILGPEFGARKLLVAERSISRGGTVSVPEIDGALEVAFYLRLFRDGDGPPEPAVLSGPESGTGTGLPLPDGAAVARAKGGCRLDLSEKTSGYVLLTVAADKREAAAEALCG